MEYLFQILTIFLILEIAKAGVVQQKHPFQNYNFPELQYVDHTVDPCDNFYDFACGNFEKYHPRPEQELLWDNFKILQEQINTISTDILNSQTHGYETKAVRKAKDMFAACANFDMIEQKDVKPLIEVIKDISTSWPYDRQDDSLSWEMVGDLIAEYGLPFFFKWNVLPYVMDANIYMITIGRDDLGLPSTFTTHIDDMPKDFLPDTPETFQAKAGPPPYVQFLQYAFRKIVDYNYNEITNNIKVDDELLANKVQDALNVMMQIKNSDLSKIEGKSTKEDYIDTIGELQTWTDTFSQNFSTRINWVNFFNRAFAKSGAQINEDTKVSINNQGQIAAIIKIFENTTPEQLKNYIITRLITFMSPDTTPDIWNEFKSLYKKLNYPVYERNEYCMRKIMSFPNIGMSLAVAHEYQSFYFDVEKVVKPKQLIEDLFDAFFELLEENSWMDAPAKEWVKEKAKSMIELLGFPDFVYDKKQLDEYYSKLRVCRHDHFGNTQKLRAFSFAKTFEVIDKPRDRTIWSQSPLYVNAFYNQLNNRIIFPAAIMNKPFFSGKPCLEDYSRIGALVGHEITHGFDSHGKDTDGNGTVADAPWKPEVVTAFEERENCFRKQYWKYCIEELQLYVDGNKTIAENIADNGGLREAYRAFKKLEKRLPYEIQSKEFTAEQLFFISYGSMWCKIDTVQSLQKMYNDVHAPNRFRVIGTLSNMKEFSDAFNCPVGSTMNPVDKCILW